MEERFLKVMKHLGIKLAHFAASKPSDWRGLVSVYPQLTSTLMLVSPRAIDERILGPIASELLVFNGDHGGAAESLQHSMTILPNATVVNVPDYLRSNMEDVVADRGENILSALFKFLDQNY